MLSEVIRKTPTDIIGNWVELGGCPSRSGLKCTGRIVWGIGSSNANLYCSLDKYRTPVSKVASLVLFTSILFVCVVLLCNSPSQKQRRTHAMCTDLYLSAF